MKSLALVLLAFTLSAQQRPPETILKEIGTLIDEYRTVQQTPPVVTVPDGGDFAKAIAAAPEGSTLTLAGTVTGNFTIGKKLKVQGGRIITPNGAPALTITGNEVEFAGTYIGITPLTPGGDLVVVSGNKLTFSDAVIEGNYSTKRACACNGSEILFQRTTMKGIGKFGQETQVVAMWDSSGPMTFQNSTLSGGSTSILLGGSTPTIPNTVPTNILVEDSTLTRDVDAMKGKGFAVKTGFECKSCRNVIVRRTTIDNVWVDGQQGHAITLTPVNYVNSPETVVEHVLFEDVNIRNAAGGVNLLGTSQQTLPTLQTHDIEFSRGTWNISKVWAGGGQGALLQAGRSPADIRFHDLNVTVDGDAIFRVTDTKVFTGFSFKGNTVTGGGNYGIFSAAGSRGGAWFLTQFPDGVITGNTFIGMNSIFKANFGSNTYAVAIGSGM